MKDVRAQSFRIMGEENQDEMGKAHTYSRFCS